jgi:hypothetical protein
MYWGAMIGNYEERCVGRWDNEEGDKMVSTAYVSDGAKNYETAFEHPDYNNGNMIIVESYDTKDEASDGHARWVEIMTNGPLPDSLIDCSNSAIGQFAEDMGCDPVFERQKS